MNQMNMAKANNITKILNTEVGASFWENTDFNQKNVGRLESFLTECQALGVVNCLWMNMDTINWQEYTQNDYHPKPSPLPPATPSTAAPIPMFSSTLSHLDSNTNSASNNARTNQANQ